MITSTMQNKKPVLQTKQKEESKKRKEWAKTLESTGQEREAMGVAYGVTEHTEISSQFQAFC